MIERATPRKGKGEGALGGKRSLMMLSAGGGHFDKDADARMHLAQHNWHPSRMVMCLREHTHGALLVQETRAVNA